MRDNIFMTGWLILALPGILWILAVTLILAVPMALIENFIPRKNREQNIGGKLWSLIWE